MSEYAWLQLAGIDYQKSKLPLPLFRTIYSDILTYGPEAETIQEFLAMATRETPEDFVASIDYLMGVELAEFEAQLALFLNPPGGDFKNATPTQIIIQVMEGFEVAKYRDLWTNLGKLAGSAALEKHAAEAHTMPEAYIRFLNLCCWTLVGEQVFPPNTQVEVYRSRLRSVTAEYLKQHRIPKR